MFRFSAVLFLFVSLSAYSKVIKTCTSDSHDSYGHYEIEISELNGKYSAVIELSINGTADSVEGAVQKREGKVQAGITADTDMNLSYVEEVIKTAMEIEELTGTSTGIDLKKVRFARVYIFEVPANLATKFLVEVKDKKGNDLGSFLTGMLVSPCQM